MSFADNLKAMLSEREPRPVAGTWRPISLCLDDTACEFLNVGVVFSHSEGIEVRMLDTFERLKCLYDHRFDKAQLQYLLMDIEAALAKTEGELPDALSDTIHLGPALYAQGESAEQIIDFFFEDVVTLARPKPGSERSRFRYRSSIKLRQAILDRMASRLGLLADKVIQDQAFQLPLSNGKSIEVDVPLLSHTAVGAVASAWYKNPTVVENNILQAGSDLTLVASQTKRRPSLSLLVPGPDSGLDHKERGQVERAVEKRLERLERTGCTILRDNSTEGLAEKTIEWWRKHGAA